MIYHIQFTKELLDISKACIYLCSRVASFSAIKLRAHQGFTGLTACYYRFSNADSDKSQTRYDRVYENASLMSCSVNVAKPVYSCCVRAALLLEVEHAKGRYMGA